MYYVYILQSKINDEIYVGSTNDIGRRLKEHNNGEEMSTRRYMPWGLLYYEAYQTEGLARMREKGLKSHGNAIRELKKRIALSKSGAGYRAIASAVIISALLLGIAGALSFSMYFARFNVFDSFTKERSRALAESCADTALLKLRQSGSYSGNETVTINGTETCTILPFEISGPQKIIKTTATVLEITTNIKVTVSGTVPMLVSWEENP